MADIHTSDQTLFIRTNNNAVIEWQIDNYVPGTKVKLEVDQDPGTGKNPVPEAPDANTDPTNGAGKFVTVMGKKGFFAFTLTIGKPGGPEKATINVSVQPMTITKLESASGTSAEVNKPLKLSWSVDRGDGCSFKLVTTAPDQSETRKDVQIDKDGNGSTEVKPDQLGKYTFQIESADPTLQAGQTSPKSFAIQVDVRPPLTLALELTGPAYDVEIWVPKHDVLHKIHQLRKDDQKRPIVRGGRQVRAVWSVKSPTDLKSIDQLRFVDSKSPDKFAALTFDPAQRSASGDQPFSFEADNAQDEQRKFSLVCLDAKGAELQRLDLEVTVPGKLVQDRLDMLALIDVFYPSSLSAPRKNGKALDPKKQPPERDIMALAGWTKQKGEDSKKVKDAGGKVLTSCGDVLAAMLRQWQSQFVGAFGIVDQGIEVPPGKEPPPGQKMPGAKALGYYHEAQAGELPTPGDAYVLWNVKDNIMAHIGMIVELYDGSLMTADGGAAGLPDQAALIGHGDIKVEGGFLTAPNPTTGGMNKIVGWIVLDKIPRDKSKPIPT